MVDELGDVKPNFHLAINFATAMLKKLGYAYMQIKTGVPGYLNFIGAVTPLLSEH